MLNDLYQDVILDHSRTPRNTGKVAAATHHAVGHNPLCGDIIHVELLVAEGVVQEARFSGSGCAISTASASIMTEAVKGKTLEEVERLFDEVRAAFTRDEMELPDEGSLAALQGVKNYPVRVKCATLAWHALHAAIRGGAKATTE
jgi:nitrogen fixation NifU-like protein